ncbi:CRISPR-associated protein Csb2 [Crossiella equi]|uniref:CRISPR-associated protein Csb2 n=1 Tax=Crossiella equi TaxID=130796 RepID=A0ABS5AN97_9PSEU|nr:type I-U CRISPR-associated protein Csb2 [Crossiella equi]MBP2477669.1 CRISPR-associated protein Csb2 [Crossiella equi]
MLAVRVQLLHGRYEAAGSREMSRAEWPPHPARLHCALLAGAHSSAHARLLRWLEAQDPPQVWADAQPAWEGEHHSYVVTGKTSASGGSQFHPARTSQARRRAVALLRHPEFVFVWPEVSVSETEAEVLAELAARVPYFGRSTATALLSVHHDPADLADLDDLDLAHFIPDTGTTAGRLVELRVPYRGYTDALDAAFAEGRRAWEVSGPPRTYLLADHQMEEQVEAEPEAPGGPFVDMLMFGLPRGFHLDGLHAGRVTGKLRHTVMARVPDPVPAQVSGHGADDRAHVAYLPILDAGHRHAGGHLLGVALGLPKMDPADRRRLLQAVGNPAAPLALELGGAKVELQIEGRAQDRAARRLDKSWWQRPATRWATVTPMVLEHYCGLDHEEEEIARSCRRAGLPEPVEIIPGTAPMIRGGAALRREHLPRKEKGPRPFAHVLLRFPVPVRGPVLLGAQRYLGMGLFAPLPDQDDRDE